MKLKIAVVLTMLLMSFQVWAADKGLGNGGYKLVKSWGQKGAGDGNFLYVEDFAIDTKGNLLATDALRSDIQVFKKDGTYFTKFAGKGFEDHHMEKPEGIAVDRKTGNIHVSDYLSGAVKIYDKNYKWLKTYSDYGDAPGETAKSEFGSINPKNNLNYVPEAGNHRVSTFDMDGNFKFLFGKKGTGDGELNNPEAAKILSNGDVVVSDLKNHRIQIFDMNGKFLRKFGSEGTAPGQMKKPAGIGIDKNDNIYVAEMGNSRVQVFNKNGKPLAMWGSEGSDPGQFGNLHGIIVDKDGAVYVADTANNRVQKFAK